MNADADPQRPAADLVDLVHRHEHFARRGDRMLRGVGRLERRAEQRQKAIAEKLVHDAAMAIEDIDQDRERAVEALDHLLRRPRPGRRR